jgi:hypothetical protein
MGSSRQPLLYHRQVLNYLKVSEKDVFNWYESAVSKSNYADAMRLELLKSSYRLERKSHPGLYSISDEVLKVMELDCPLTLYKSNEGGTGAAIFYSPEEIHISLYGNILEKLNEDELKAVIAHEVGHFDLFSMENSQFLICSRILYAAAEKNDTDPAHDETYRRFGLVSEIFADRNAYHITGDIKSMVSTLVKIETGMNEVDPDAYLRQVDDILASGKIESQGLTHPEIYIRCAALKMFIDDPETADEKIFKLISNSLSIKNTDLIEQLTLCSLTQSFIEELLKPTIFQDELLQSQAKFYDSEDLQQSPIENFDWQSIDDETRDYFISLIFDFSFVNPDLKDAMLCWGNYICVDKGWDKQYSLKLTKNFKYKSAEVKRLLKCYSKEDFLKSERA